MTKKDIVLKITDMTGIKQVDVKKVVQKTFDAIIDSLIRSEKVELRNFGVFKIKERKQQLLYYVVTSQIKNIQKMQTLRSKMGNLFSFLKAKLSLTNILILGLGAMLLLQKCSNDAKMRQLQNTVASQEYIVSERINELGEKVLTTSANAFNASELKILKTIDSRYNALEDHLKANNRKIKDLQSSISFNVFSFLGE